MALISCPHCNKQTSSASETCSQCNRSLTMTNEEMELLSKKRKRELKNKVYKWKMFSFLAMAIAMVGAVPMVWDYARAVDYGFNTSLMNHWGATWVFSGFVLYVLTRVMIFLAKKS